MSMCFFGREGWRYTTGNLYYFLDKDIIVRRQNCGKAIYLCVASSC